MCTILNKDIREGPTKEVTSEQDLKEMQVRHKHKGPRQEGTAVCTAGGNVNEEQGAKTQR